MTSFHMGGRGGYRMMTLHQFPFLGKSFKTLNSAKKISLYFDIFSSIMKQTYFREQKYSKNYLVSKSQNLYEKYINAFAFSEMIKSQNAALNKRELQQHAQSSWREIRTKDKDSIHNLISELLKTPIQPSPLIFFHKIKP